MKFLILGSGGCVALPKPLCHCKICKEAREKGKPYSRFGCSLYLEDIGLLIDTPEDIVHALNYSNVSQVNSVMFSHMDPDHTLGMRVFEHMRLNWLNVSEGIECQDPINVFAMEHVMCDINSIGSVRGSFLDYYEETRNLIRRNSVRDQVYLNNIKITFIKIDSSTVFVFEDGNSKLIYAPCDTKPFPQNDLFNNADVLIIGNTFVGEVLKNDYVLSEENILRKELFSMDEIQDLKNNYNICKVIITHIEEDWGKSYDDYLHLQSNYNQIYFAYDGMKVIV
ncbi:phosphoribosyl 1,2-cyclic phosphate phosphodiesterase [Natranaerovirga pectinivora]|uniref:Phosphoribosyl 1,2-cyclic phosphate phosphodiesterase n=1 Tax=Natranaerovirga pectinivora TaxID=682400 RepID=A0A4V2V0Q0_9FIRM|nr:MBL fold metallo-hydrolase [Natranaerovirga pectinivora]TCT17189.1 phosphoribosyl 1,2-cyclic phosphate phosphodiesterase [Natranaerovirga pectinivora]